VVIVTLVVLVIPRYIPISSDPATFLYPISFLSSEKMICGWPVGQLKAVNPSPF
jgi:hypothetical protein